MWADDCPPYGSRVVGRTRICLARPRNAARALLAGLLLASSPAWAQGTAVNLFGTVAHIDAGSIAVKNEDGATESFKLAPGLLVVQNKPATLADIKPGDYVASAAVHGVDGKLHSTELRIFPAAMRGVGEGQRPMNDARAQTMTNATVSGAAVVNGSNDIKVTFAGGESELVLDPGIPVLRLEPAERAQVIEGARVRVQGVRDANGATISRITIQ